MTKIFAVIAIFLASIFGQHKNIVPVSQSSTVTLDNKTFSVEVADTEADQERGLSGHTPLSDNQGMLFVFSNPDNYGFWMKGMTFPLDIIWFDQNFRVVHIEKNLSPRTYPKIYYPGTNSVYVLEINAGQTDILKTKIGDLMAVSTSSLK